jgi:hypothetical protein
MSSAELWYRMSGVQVRKDVEVLVGLQVIKGSFRKNGILRKVAMR